MNVSLFTTALPCLVLRQDGLLSFFLLSHSSLTFDLQPLADAIHYQNHDVIKLLEKHGAKLHVSPFFL